MCKIRKEGLIVGILNLISGLILGTAGIIYFANNNRGITFETSLTELVKDFEILKPLLILLGTLLLTAIIILIGISSIKSALKTSPENKVKKGSYILSIILTSIKIILFLVWGIINWNLVISVLTLKTLLISFGLITLTTLIMVFNIKTLAKNRQKISKK